MRLWHVLRLLWRADGWAMWRGAALSVLVLVMGAALLGLSGWFITATGLAGLAGIGIAFDVFRPSAGVRFLALGRAGARYAERLLTHDATLRALAQLRVTLMARLERWSIVDLRQLRGASALTRITADVDALDGVALRLVLPLVAALLTHLLAFLALGWLVAPVIALSVAAGYVLGGALVLLRVALTTLGPSAQAEEAMQTLRTQAIGLFRGQRDILLQGRLPEARADLAATEAAARAAQDWLDRIDTGAGLALAVVVALVVAVVLALTGHLVAGGLNPAPAAIGVFVALALAETLLPLRRGLAEIGRMHSAAGRILGDTSAPPPVPAPPAAVLAPDPSAGLRVDGLSVTRPNTTALLIERLSIAVRPGEMLALRGASGSGKSTVLDALTGIVPVADGAVLILGVPLEHWSETQLYDHLTLVPQRAALLGGTIRENLALAQPDLSDAEAREALRIVALDRVVTDRGGLEARLGEGGAGLSGGEARRLVLARALLRRPAVLLLDEATEGLDDATARQVLANLRAACPQTAIVAAAHRAAEVDAADIVLDLEKQIQECAFD